MDFDTSLYSPLKRLRFFEKQIGETVANRPSSKIIELGCGTGEGLLGPLAERFPQSSFTGIDNHVESIEHARKKFAPLENLAFHQADAGQLPAALRDEKWDVVIASEVLEHCEDPFAVLTAASDLLTMNGLLLVTVPNGYGPFECEKLVWGMLGLENAMNAARKWRGKKPVWENPTTLNAADTHVCFFSWKEINRLIRAAGFDIGAHENREFFCGPFSDLSLSVLKRIGLGRPLVAFSQTSARFLPAALVSDWMISARKVRAPQPTQSIVPPRGGLKRWWWKTKRKLSLSEPC